MTDLTDQEKKLLIKMQIEEETDHKSGVSYIMMVDPDEEKEREALKEKLKKRKEVTDEILEVDFLVYKCILIYILSRTTPLALQPLQLSVLLFSCIYYCLSSETRWV